MQSIASMRGIAVAILLGGGVGFAQSTLPATSPTAAPAASSAATAKASPAAAVTGLPGATQTGRPAQVTYSPGVLEVIADDSSLNQILRGISRQTGMKLSGGVADERVFGKYGPAAPAEVIAILLDGTNTNMLLRETASSAPEELILTPREGGPTPPDLNGVASNNGGSSNPQASGQQLPGGEDRPAEVGPPRLPYPGTGGVDGAPQPTGPNYVPPKFMPPPPADEGQTPQRIYQQLQQMQQTPVH